MTTETIDVAESLQTAIEPLESLHEEHSQLEVWVHDSFAALEKLHSELTEWQSELARKQTEIDLREDAVRRGEEQVVGGDAAEQIEHWKKQAEESSSDMQALEEENSEQLQELENMELELVQLEKQLQSAEKKAKDLGHLLEAERLKADQEQHQWQGEFKEMRRLLDKQCSLLEDRIRDSRDTPGDETDEQSPNHEGEDASAPVSRAAELRRRSKQRREARLRRNSDSEESSDS